MMSRSSEQQLATYVLLPTRIDGFALGVLAALAMEQSAATLQSRIRLLSLLSVLLFVAIEFLSPHAFGPFQAALIACNETRFSLVFVCVLLWVVAIPNGKIARVFATRPLAWIGSTSYFVYLFHLTVNHLVHWAVRTDVPSLNTISGAATTLLALTILFALAELSRRFLEQPLIALGHRFTYGNEPTPSITDITPLLRSGP
jgi:peptidoglycan/LPS O-acetylase OafA/YrhL